MQRREQDRLKEWIASWALGALGVSSLVMAVVAAATFAKNSSTSDAVWAVAAFVILSLAGFYLLGVARRAGVVRVEGGFVVREAWIIRKEVRAEDVDHVTIGWTTTSKLLPVLCPCLVYKNDVRGDKGGSVRPVGVLGFIVIFGLGRSRIIERARILAQWLDVPFAEL